MAFEIKKTAKILFLVLLTYCLSACFFSRETKFASDAPIKKLVSFFPTGLIYQSSPDEKIIIGKKNISAAIFEISGFERESGKKLWQLPFVGEVVGETEKQILIFEESTNSVHFINPNDGQITRKISPAPLPLSSKTTLESGMAFTDELYLTTKPLYGQVFANGKIDESWKIGITAKIWENNEEKWFVPPVRQIVIIEYKPVILGEKVLLINTRQKIGGPHSYQNVSLKTGEELFRADSEGEFCYLGKGYFMEQTSGFVRRIDPNTNKDIWRIEADFTNASVSSINNQITISTPHPTHIRTIRIVDAETGKILKQFDLPDLQRTVFHAAFLTKANQIWLHFANGKVKDSNLGDYDYVIGYDTESKKALWRTEFNNYSESSLLNLVGDNMKIE